MPGAGVEVPSAWRRNVRAIPPRIGMTMKASEGRTPVELADSITLDFEQWVVAYAGSTRACARVGRLRASRSPRNPSELHGCAYRADPDRGWRFKFHAILCS